MSDWLPIETADKTAGSMLLFGCIDPDHRFSAIRWDKPSVFTGYWDSLDEAWCASGSTWEGPFMRVTHWMPLPAPPQGELP